MNKYKSNSVSVISESNTKNMNIFICFINSLISLPSFIKNMRSMENMEEHYTKENNLFGLSFIKFVESIYIDAQDTQNSQNSEDMGTKIASDPNKNVAKVAKVGINELYNNFLQMLIKKKRKRKAQNIFTVLNDILVFLQPDNLSYEDKSISDIFLVRWRYRMVCSSCGHKTKLYAKESCSISGMEDMLGLIGTKYTFDINSLKKVTKSINGYECSGCGSSKYITKESYLSMLRDVIILVFNKSSALNYTVPKYLEVSHKKDRIRKYKLCSQICSRPNGYNKPGRPAKNYRYNRSNEATHNSIIIDYKKCSDFECTVLRKKSNYYKIEGNEVCKTKIDEVPIKNCIVLFYHYFK